MIEEQLFKNAKTYIRNHCDADDYTFIASRTDSHEIRFAQNAITQHMAGADDRITLHVAYGNKTGSASINQIDDEALQYLIDTAQQIAKLNQPDPEYVASEPQHPLPDVSNYSEKTAAISMEEMVGKINRCVSNAIDKHAKVSGMVEKHIRMHYMATKNGFEGSDRSSVLSHSMTMKKDAAETKVSKRVKDVGEYHVDELIDQLNSQVDALHSPASMDAEKIPVILRPPAAWNFFVVMTRMMDMRDADEGVSAFTDQLGKPFFGPMFTCKSVIDDPLLITQKFNGSGLPAKPMIWVNQGIIENLMVSRYYANQKKIPANFPCNFYIEGGDLSEQDMMNAVDRGLIINDFWYIRSVDRKRGELTGMTRDGVLYFEDGKVKHTVNNFRWNEIPHEATRRFLGLGKGLPFNGNFSIPTMLIDGFNLVDTTTF